MLLMVFNVFKKSNKKEKVFEKTKEKMKKSSKGISTNFNSDGVGCNIECCV